MNIYAVYDRKSEQLFSFHFAATSYEVEALNFLRSVAALSVSEPTNSLVLFPSDYDLVCIGDYDESDHTLLGYDTMALVCHASDYVSLLPKEV